MHYLMLLLLVEGLCVLGVAADYFLKLAGAGPEFVNTRTFALGFLLHSSTAIGWFLALKYMKLYQVGAYYSVSIVLMLTLLGVYQFQEQLTHQEILGLVLAVASLCLLGRFA